MRNSAPTKASFNPFKISKYMLDPYGQILNKPLNFYFFNILIGETHKHRLIEITDMTLIVVFSRYLIHP